MRSPIGDGALRGRAFPVPELTVADRRGLVSCLKGVLPTAGSTAVLGGVIGERI